MVFATVLAVALEATELAMRPTEIRVVKVTAPKTNQEVPMTYMFPPWSYPAGRYYYDWYGQIPFPR